MAEKETDVFEIATVEQLKAFCDGLLEMKQTAPVSLRFMVAVTALRDVQYLGAALNGGGLAASLAGVQSAMPAEVKVAPPPSTTPVATVEPKVPLPKKSKGRRRAQPSNKH